MLEKEYKYFQENLDSLLKKHKGKFLIIKDSSVQGVFETYNQALTNALAKYKLGEFLIQECIKESLSTAHFFNSNLIVNEKSF